MLDIAFTFSTMTVLAIAGAAFVNSGDKRLLDLSISILAAYLVSFSLQNILWNNDGAVQNWYIKEIVINYIIIYLVQKNNRQWKVADHINIAIILICFISSLLNLTQFTARNIMETDDFNVIYSFSEKTLSALLVIALYHNKISVLLKDTYNGRYKRNNNKHNKNNKNNNNNCIDNNCSHH